MRFLLSSIILLLSAVVALGQIHDLPVDSIATIDMRHGLSESRIRAIHPLPDGRVAVATAGYLNIFDGTSLKSTSVELETGVKLKATGKARQLFHDNAGRIWLKTPATRNYDTEHIHIFNAVTGKDITRKVITQPIIDNLKDIFVDESGCYWMIDSTNSLYRIFPDDKSGSLIGPHKELIINLNRISQNLPGAISTAGNNIFLCYDNGKVCALDISSGMLKHMGGPALPTGTMRLTKTGVRWNNSHLSVAFHKHNDNHHTWIATLDTLRWDWKLKEFNEMLYDFEIDNSGNLLTEISSMPNEIFCMSFDRNGALWVGTKENGLRYLNPKRYGTIKCVQEPYPYKRSGYYVSDRAKEAAERHVGGVINCSAEDSITKYIYLGTPKGLMVIDSAGTLVATLAANIGLSQYNIQNVVANVPYSGKRLTSDTIPHRDEIWFSTTVGISRLRHLSRDSFEIIHLGILDGLELNGSELYHQSMKCDSTGMIIAGYPNGSCRFYPKDIDEGNHVIYLFPNPDIDDFDAVESNSNKIIRYMAEGIIFLILLVITLFLYIRYFKKRMSIAQLSHSILRFHSSEMDRLCDNIVTKYNETKLITPPAPHSVDNDFVQRLNRTIEQHLGDESLNVESLSRLMAMDRTNLYRKMQSVMGSSPSVYIKNMRLSAAARLLRKTDMSVAEIARQTGFSSTKYFSSSFKESFGVLPNKYRATTESSGD